MGWGGMEWIALGEDRNRCRAVVSAVMNLPVSIKFGDFFNNPRARWFLRTESAPWS